MKTFKIIAKLGQANIVAQGNCDDLDTMISQWEGVLGDVGVSDFRDETKNFVIQALTTDEHHRDPTCVTAQGVALALTWLTAKGQIGPAVLPFLRAGDLTLIIEITKLGADKYNFRPNSILTPAARWFCNVTNDGNRDAKVSLSNPYTSDFHERSR